jgi:hypothetical protein
MSKVKIINSYWDRIELQVRIGDQEPAEANPEAFDEYLNRNDEQDFDFEVFLFYRREANPDNPDGNYSAWTQCFVDQTIDNP